MSSAPISREHATRLDEVRSNNDDVECHQPTFQVPVGVLLATDVAFNFAFYLVLPLLARHLVEGIGVAAGLSGFVLGIRSLFHQGMFTVGGLLAERIGARACMVAGCGLRAAAFAGFAMSETVTPLIVCSAFAGFAGALFTPAMKALLAESSESERANLFSKSETLQQVGALAGPAAGIALSAYGFSAIAAVGAAVFFLWGAVLWLSLPNNAQDLAREHVVSKGWLEWIGFSPELLKFSALSIVYVTMFNQLYLCLPLSLARVAPEWSSGTLFMAFGFAILLCYRPARSLTKKLNVTRRLSLGYAIMGLAWLAVIGAPSTEWAKLLHLLCAAVLGVGSIVAYPAIMERIPVIAGEKRMAVAFGFFYTVAWGIGGTAGNFISGIVFERAPSVLWLAMVLGAGLYAALLYHRDRAIEGSFGVPPNPG